MTFTRPTYVTVSSLDGMLISIERFAGEQDAYSYYADRINTDTVVEIVRADGVIVDNKVISLDHHQ